MTDCTHENIHTCEVTRTHTQQTCVFFHIFIYLKSFSSLNRRCFIRTDFREKFPLYPRATFSCYAYIFSSPCTLYFQYTFAFLAAIFFSVYSNLLIHVLSIFLIFYQLGAFFYIIILYFRLQTVLRHSLNNKTSVTKPLL